MFISVNKIEIPDSCPKNCMGLDPKTRHIHISQGGLCHRCPIFCCKKNIEYDFCLLKPEGYREDWAIVWRDWFLGDMKTYPELKF